MLPLITIALLSLSSVAAGTDPANCIPPGKNSDRSTWASVPTHCVEAKQGPSKGWGEKIYLPTEVYCGCQYIQVFIKDKTGPGAHDVKVPMVLFGFNDNIDDDVQHYDKTGHGAMVTDAAVTYCNSDHKYGWFRFATPEFTLPSIQICYHVLNWPTKW